jgi:hypothetical protein
MVPGLGLCHRFVFGRDLKTRRQLICVDVFFTNDSNLTFRMLIHKKKVAVVMQKGIQTIAAFYINDTSCSHGIILTRKYEYEIIS